MNRILDEYEKISDRARYWHHFRELGPLAALIPYVLWIAIFALLIRTYFDLQEFIASGVRVQSQYPTGLRREGLGYFLYDTPYRNSALLVLAFIVSFEARTKYWFAVAVVMVLIAC